MQFYATLTSKITAGLSLLARPTSLERLCLMRPIKPLFCHSVKFRVLCGFISEWSHLYYCLGQQDNVLSDHGRQQARQVAARLAREPFTAVYSSDLLRASEVGKVDSGLVWTPGPSHHSQNHSAAWDERYDEQNRSTQLTWLLLVGNSPTECALNAHNADQDTVLPVGSSPVDKPLPQWIRQ